MRRLTTIVVSTLLFTSCAISEDAVPRDIPLEQRVSFGEVATGQAAVGGGRIYLLGPVDGDEQAQLRAVQRIEASSPEDLLNSLLDGANADENSIGLSTAIPADLVIDQARTVGTRLTIDINDAFNELSDIGLRQAIAQIVATASEIDQVQQIRIRVDGENQGWPTGDGEVTDRPLSIYDYPGFLETSQPAFTALPSA